MLGSRTRRDGGAGAALAAMFEDTDSDDGYDSASSESIASDDDEDAPTLPPARLSPWTTKWIAQTASQFGSAVHTLQKSMSDSPYLGRVVRIASRSFESTNAMRAALADLDTGAGELAPGAFNRLWSELAKRSTDAHFPRTPKEFHTRLGAAMKSMVALPRLMLSLGVSADESGLGQGALDIESLPGVLDALEQTLDVWATQIAPAATRTAAALRACVDASKARRQCPKASARDVHRGVATIVRSAEGVKGAVERATDLLWKGDGEDPMPRGYGAAPLALVGWLLRTGSKVLLTLGVWVAALVAIAAIVVMLVVLFMAIGGPVARQAWEKVVGAIDFGEYSILKSLVAHVLTWTMPDKVGYHLAESLAKFGVSPLPVVGSVFGVPMRLFRAFMSAAGLEGIGWLGQWSLDPTAGESTFQKVGWAVWGAAKGAFGTAIKDGTIGFTSGGPWGAVASGVLSFFSNLNYNAGIDAYASATRWTWQLYGFWFITLFGLAWKFIGPLALRAAKWAIGAAWKKTSEIWSRPEAPSLRDSKDAVGAAVEAASVRS